MSEEKPILAILADVRREDEWKQVKAMGHNFN